MATLEPKYSLHASVEQMLAADTLSELLSKHVTRVTCQPMNGHSGLAGGRLSYVNTNEGRLVLKEMSSNTDWIMYSSNDTRCRAVRLWQYGLLDQMLPHLEHKILACAHDGDGWAILMEDLTGLSGDEAVTPNSVPVFLDALARLHARFWSDTSLEDPRLGLQNSAQMLKSIHLAENYEDLDKGVLPKWIQDGWKSLDTLLEPKVYQLMKDLIENPLPLVEAIQRYPATLLHGDYRGGNLAYNGSPIALDWQGASRSLMSFDLAWFTKWGYVTDTIGEEEAARYYRNRLEGYLNWRFDEPTWQAMIGLGYALDALIMAGFFGFFYLSDPNPENKRFNKQMVQRLGERVQTGIRWI